MKTSRFVLPVVAVLLGLLTMSPALGASKKKAPPPSHPAPVISSVNANTITVAEEKTVRTFTITQFTEINVNGQRATIADLKPGMTVSITMGTDPTKASRINATGK
jgi:hypothetical protein